MVPVPATGVSALADELLALVADEHDARRIPVYLSDQVVAGSLAPAPPHGVRTSAA